MHIIRNALVRKWQGVKYVMCSLMFAAGKASDRVAVRFFTRLRAEGETVTEGAKGAKDVTPFGREKRKYFQKAVY